MAGEYPRVEVVEEAPREGMQIESRGIATADKIALIDRLARTGLRTIVVGSFVSPRWVPQMDDIAEVVAGITPVDGVTYRALALNRKGVELRERQTPPVSPVDDQDRFATRLHLCDVFVRRNANRRRSDETASWPGIIARALEAGLDQATIGVNAAWGSNWQGPFTLAERMHALEEQHAGWTAQGVAVTKVWLGDPMGWTTPQAVAEQLDAITQRWPAVRTVHLHLHNTRGLALTSAYAALSALRAEHTLVLDASVGGIGGCPYCGNGRATGMIATEDLVHLLHTMGIDTGVDLDLLIEASHFASRLVGRMLDGHVSRAGAFPSESRRYSVDLPLVETFEEAQHFRRGHRVVAGGRRPWRPSDPLHELTAASGA
jgi:hydroxymethylglutaryl-CoA lyase